jgi:hypothetical protein
MAIQRKQFHDAKSSTGKPAKKVKNKLAKEKHKKSKLVSALFSNEDEFQSAFDGEFKLSRNHVKKLGRIIQQSDSQLKQALLLIYTNEGYKALKCKSFKAYIKKHQTITYDAALKQVWAAKVAYVVNGLDAIGFFSDNSMLPMKDLSDVQIKNVVEQIEEEHDMDITNRGKYTRKMVEAAMRELDLLDDIDDVPVSDRDDDQAEDEEDAVEQTDNDLDLDFDDSNDEDFDTKPIAKPVASTKKPSNAKQSNLEKVEQNESHSQFLQQFKMKADKFKSSKAIIAAFIETDAGQKSKNVKKAIKLLTKHLKTLEA